MADYKSSAMAGLTRLNGNNYATWKIQCKMTLMKDGVWSIADGTETFPDDAQRREQEKFIIRRDQALASIVLSIDPSLLYLLGDPQDPFVVWQKLCDQFQKKTWSNKLSLKRKLYGLKLKNYESVQNHIKTMMEIFQELAVIGDAIDEEDKVVHLLASLPEQFDVLVTALQASSEVPSMETVTERLLHEERKVKERESDGNVTHHGKALAASEEHYYGKYNKQNGPPKCYSCGNIGHIKRFCPKLKKEKDASDKRRNYGGRKDKANVVDQQRRKYVEDSDSSDCGFVTVSHALFSTSIKTNNWIVDSGATSHMCNDENEFRELILFEKPKEVIVGDGNSVEAKGEGVIELMVNISASVVEKCKLVNVLLCPRPYI